MKSPRAPRAPAGSADPDLLAPDGGALYIHLQSENGVEHRTIVLSRRRVRVLRALWSWWGVALVVAIGGSWAYFAMQAARVPYLTRRVAQLEVEGQRLDTLQLRLQQLMQQYDQVQRMLGVSPTKSDTVPDSAPHKQTP